MRNIPFLQLGSAVEELRPQIDTAIKRVLDSGWYLLGSELEQMEKEWASWCGADYCIGVSNGLDALNLVLRAWDIGVGDEVIVPSNTYIASWLAVSMTGATPVPVEPKWETCCIDPERIEQAITSKTKAIMPVHMYGQACDMNSIMNIAKKHDLKVVEDAAQAHGASIEGKRIGSHGDAVAWSFYPSKNLGALGDAGAVTTNNLQIFKKIKMLQNYGSSIRYENEILGSNNRLEALHAAILSEKIKVLSDWNKRRVYLAERYQKAFEGLDIIRPNQSSKTQHAWHLYTIRHPRRDLIQSYLNKVGVGTLIHYPIPPYEQKAYSYLSLNKKDFPISERIHSQILSLPLHPHLKEKDQDYIIEAVKVSLKEI